MKIATWNVNSIRVRLPRLLSWLERHRPDIVCLQEIKVVDKDFPKAEIEALGYNCLTNGQKTYNGVAILSLYQPVNIAASLPGDPIESEKRLLVATIDTLTVINVYVPNGSEVGSSKYEYKLNWYSRLRTFLDSFDPAKELLICGDFNVAPHERDVWNPVQWEGQVLFSQPEKDAFERLISWGFEDTLRKLHPEEKIYTWWDYRAGAFHRGWGLRIDHILATPPLANRCKEVYVDREERKGEKPSDHAPVIAVFE
jgi:exodeoxyribonuclease-3